jgi:hypothetical protein
MFCGHDDPARLHGETFEALVRESIRNGETPEEGYDIESWVAERVRRHREPKSTPILLKIGGGRWISVAEQRVPASGSSGSAPTSRGSWRPRPSCASRATRRRRPTAPSRSSSPT